MGVVCGVVEAEAESHLSVADYCRDQHSGSQQWGLPVNKQKSDRKIRLG